MLSTARKSRHTVEEIITGQGKAKTGIVLFLYPLPIVLSMVSAAAPYQVQPKAKTDPSLKQQTGKSTGRRQLLSAAIRNSHCFKPMAGAFTQIAESLRRYTTRTQTAELTIFRILRRSTKYYTRFIRSATFTRAV